MEFNELISTISNVGFPITCCIGMAWYINTSMKKFTETVDANTRMLEKLCLSIQMKGVEGHE